MVLVRGKFLVRFLMSFFDPPDDPREIIGDTPAEMIDEDEHARSIPFVWVSCSAPGWQALISVDQVNLPVPEPPGCIIEPTLEYDLESCKDYPVGMIPNHPTNPSNRRGRGSLPSRGAPFSYLVQRSLSPQPRNKSTAESDPTGDLWRSSLHRSESVSSYQVSGRTTPLRERDFVQENKNLKQPSRANKISVLNEAVRQLEHTERIGTTLAERLQVIHKKLNS